MLKHRFYFILFCFVTLASLAQSDTTLLKDDYYIPAPVFKFDNMVYDKRIASVQLYNQSSELSLPIIALGSNDRLKLSFDDLESDLKQYNYTVIHCNANWEPSGLMANEYIDGFQTAEIVSFAYSQNTLQKYTHYDAAIPHPSMTITKSGNYILKVFKNNDETQLAISLRFMVVEPLVMIKPNIHAANTIEFRNFKQEVDFTIVHNEYVITNPYQDLKVMVMQNNRWDNAVKSLKPSFMNNNEIVFNYEDENVFNGGSEYRYLDLKSIRNTTECIARIKHDSVKYDIYLRPDAKRSYLKYTFNKDINGNFIIKNNDGQKNSEVGGEYCYVHFFIPFNETFDNGYLYVFGAFNGWKAELKNRMTYNPAKLGYECTLYLKQGYYNYEYVFVESGSSVADQSIIEGTHYETENEYTILVYHKQQGTFYDRLIGVAKASSIR